MKRILQLTVTTSVLGASVALGQVVRPLAGRTASGPTAFEKVESFHESEVIELHLAAEDVALSLPADVDVYVVAAKTSAEWTQDRSLVDVRVDGARTLSIAASGSVTANLALPGELSSDAGAGLGVGYDVVVDVDRDGELSAPDLIDGAGVRTPGFWVLRDTSLPGPLTAQLAAYTLGTGSFVDQRTYYPANISSLGVLPLVVVSHGWTYTENMYDYIGEHLSTYGYVVMAHRSNVGDGTSSATLSAAGTLIDATDAFLGNLSTVAGGVLDGHVDSSRIMFIGHSTGGEAVVRAAHALREGEATAANFGYEDLRIVSSIAPVSWFRRTVVHPLDLNYHMFVAGADTDVAGAPFGNYMQCLSIFERSVGNRQVTYVWGAGHGDFLSCCGDLFLDTAAPNLIGRATTNLVARAHYLPLAELYLRDNLAAKEVFTRPVESFRSPGVPSEVTITNEYRDAVGVATVIDDFETETDLSVSSSETAVTSQLAHLAEVRMRDNNGSFVWNGVQESNGMTRARHAQDFPYCAVLDWNPDEPGFWRVDLAESARDFTAFEFLSLRVCQGTRHPETLALDGPLSFGLELTDAAGHVSTFAELGPILPPYPRIGGQGTGFVGPNPGWQNEFTTLRLRISDLSAEDPALDLTDVASLSLRFDDTVGTERGRIGFDDLELVPFVEPNFGTVAARGTVGVGEGGPFDVLSIGGDSGGPRRRVERPADTPLVLAMAQPTSSATPAPFALAVHLGAPTAADVTGLGAAGPLAFAPPGLGDASVLLLASSLVAGGPGGLLPATPTPWTVTIPGLPAGFSAALQGVLLDDSGALQVTNAILLEIRD